MRVAAVVLAAGAGTRLGCACKAGLRLADGQRFLAAVIDAARAGGAAPIVVVAAAPHAAEVHALAAAAGVACVDNPAPERGMASSFAAGLAALPPVDAALAWPVDHPLVAVATVRALVDADGAIVVPTFAARGGHPTRFAAALFPACIAAAGAPDGLRAVLRDHAAGVRRLTIDDAGVVRDVDSTDDYARIKDDGRR